MDPKKIRLYAVITNAVLMKAALLIGAFFLGQWLDQQFHSSPLFMMVLLVAALVLGFWWILYIAKKNKL